MEKRRESSGFVLFVAAIILAASLGSLAEQESAVSFAPSPEPESDATLAPQYLPLSPESDSISPPDSREAESEPESLSPPYAPDPSPSSELDAASPPESAFETSLPPQFSPDTSPVPETEPADTDPTDMPSIPLPLPSMAPVTGDDDDAEPSYEPPVSSPTSPFESDQSSGDGAQEATENYGEPDGTLDSSSSDGETNRGSTAAAGVVAAVCVVGLGGFVYLKRREIKTRKSKYNQYLELGKKEGV